MFSRIRARGRSHDHRESGSADAAQFNTHAKMNVGGGCMMLLLVSLSSCGEEDDNNKIDDIRYR